MQAATTPPKPLAREVIDELTGAAPARNRTPEEWLAVYEQAVATMGAAIEPIALRAAAPGNEPRRAAIARAMLGRLEATDRLNDRIFLLRQLAIVGRDESVAPLVKLLADENQAIRQYALAALTFNPAAGPALVAALREAKTPEWRVAVVNTLGARREAAAVEVLAPLSGDADEKVAMAALASLGSIGTAAAARALRTAHAGAKASPARSHEAVKAALMCADRLAATGDKPAARELYRLVYDAAATSHLRMAGLRGLVLVTGNEALPLVIAALKGGSEREQAQAARFTVELPGPDAAKTLVATLPQLPATAQAFLLEALADRESHQVN